MSLHLRSELNGGASLDAVRTLLAMPRPVSIKSLLVSWNEPVVLEEPLITSGDVALGGHHKVTLFRDGRWQYEGHFRATGWLPRRCSTT